MIDAARHVPLRPIAWNAAEAASAIDEIAADAVSAFDAQRFWPAHPLDEGLSNARTSLYAGAVGMVWALDYLARVSAAKPATSFRPALRTVLPHLLAALREDFQKVGYASHGSLHHGEMGAGLVAMRLDPAPAYADLVYRHAEANAGQPIRELMWGLPGSMLACWRCMRSRARRAGVRSMRLRLPVSPTRRAGPEAGP